MLGFGKQKIVEEYEADGSIDDLYHEIRQTLRVSGINLVFRVWAGYDKALPTLWDAVRPLVETRAFEAASDDLRAAAYRPLTRSEESMSVRSFGSGKVRPITSSKPSSCTTTSIRNCFFWSRPST